jgi:hypothetical protein
MKILVIVMSMICMMLLILSNANIFAQNGNKQQNDLIFEVKDLRTSPITKNLEITGEVWKKICPSNQCQIEENEYSNITMPDDANPHVFVTLNFYVHDNITNRDLAPIQKDIVERYDLKVACILNSSNNATEQGNDIIYKCSSGETDLQKYNREEKDSIYYFKIDGTYDTQSDTLTATGKFVR